MEATKPWYRSTTIWAAVVAVLATAAGALGMQAEEGELNALVDALTQVVAAAGAIAAVIGRIVARSRIG